jgi:hypothetical protein
MPNLKSAGALSISTKSHVCISFTIVFLLNILAKVTKNLDASALVIHLSHLNSSAFLAFVNHCLIIQVIAFHNSHCESDKLSRYFAASITFPF